MALVVAELRPVPDRPERGADPGLVERQARERRHARAGVDGQGASECRAVGVVGQCQCHAGREVRGDVPEGILGRDDESEATSGGDASGGAVVSTSWLAAAAVTVIAPVVAALSPVPVALSVVPAPALSSVSPANVATPALALTAKVPPRVAPLGLFASASVTLDAKFGVDVPEGILGRDDEAEASCRR